MIDIRYIFSKFFSLLQQKNFHRNFFVANGKHLWLKRVEKVEMTETWLLTNVLAINMVNGMTVNGLGEVAVLNDGSNATSSLLGLGKQLTNYLILGTNSLSFHYGLSVLILIPNLVLTLILSQSFGIEQNYLANSIYLFSYNCNWYINCNCQSSQQVCERSQRLANGFG